VCHTFSLCLLSTRDGENNTYNVQWCNELQQIIMLPRLLCLHQARLSDRGIVFSGARSPFVHLLPNLWNYFGNKWTAFDAKWSTVQGHETINFGGQVVKDQRHKIPFRAISKRLANFKQTWYILHRCPLCRNISDTKGQRSRPNVADDGRWMCSVVDASKTDRSRELIYCNKLWIMNSFFLSLTNHLC